MIPRHQESHQRWTDRPISYSAEELGALRELFVRFAGRWSPPLSMEDVYWLLALGFNLNLLALYVPSGQKLVLKTRSRCKTVTLEALVDALPGLVQHVLRQHYPPGSRGNDVIAALNVCWSEWIVRTVQPLADSPEETLDERHRKIATVVWAIGEGTVASGDVLLSDVWEGLEMAWKEHGHPYRSPEERCLLSLAAEAWVLSSKGFNESLYYRGEEGLIRISPRYVRDQRRHRGEKPLASVDVEDVLALEQVVNAATSAETVEGVVRALEAAEALEVVLDQERQRWPQDSLEARVLERARELLEGEVTPSGLAREMGEPGRTVRGAWTRARRRMRQSLLRMGFAPAA